MADVTGPISTLPGARHDTPDGTMCDTHPDRPAVVRVQGETDSFGSEMHDLCDECLKAIKAEGPHIGRCDWCKTEKVELRPRRDYEEGLNGPVYYVCSPCIQRSDARAAEDAREFDDYYDC